MNETKTKTKTKDFESIYLIYSEQKFLIDEAVDRLKKEIVSQSLGDLNIVQVGSPAQFEEVEQALYTVGFFDQKKVVILFQADKLSKTQVEKVEEYQKSPSPNIVLVLIALKNNAKLFSQARANKYFYEYKSPKRGQLNKWVVDYFKKEGKKVNFEAASFLVNLLGDDLGLLANEIRKISLYNESKQELNVKDIANVCSSNPHETVFDLVDSLGQADLSQALWHLNHLLGSEKEGKIFYMIVRQFRLLLETKGLVSKDKGLDEIARTLKLPPFVVSKYIRQAKNFSMSKLIDAHSFLLDAELSFKTSSTSIGQTLELALIKVLSA